MHDNWFPTAQLRWVEKKIPGLDGVGTFTEHRLQQCWRRYPEGAQREEKWHDVPLVEDDKLS